jgi:predicted lipid-binding transport protein (Tim44 family)
MKTLIIGISAALIGVALVAADAEAARVGGGRSVGSQRSVTSTPPASAPARQQQQTQQAAPSQTQNAAPAAAGKPAATPQPAPASGLSRWMPMLGGLALGGLLGALIGSSGLGSMLMSWLLIAAVVFGVVLVVRMVMAKRAGAGQPMQYAAGGPQGAGSGYASLGNETVAAPPPSQLSGFDSQSATAAISGNVPAGFDVAGFVRAAKLNFMKLQLANDSGNVEELREFTTPELFADLKKDILERGGAKQQTDVVSLNADLLEVVTEGNQHWASVRFSGLIREHPASAPESFEEVWNLAKPLDGATGWLLAGIQQTH